MQLKIWIFVICKKNTWKTWEKRSLDTTAKTGLNTLKSASKKLIHKVAKATVELIENKIAEKIVKSNVNSENVKEINTPREKREKY